MSHRWDLTVRPNTHISPPPFRGYNPFPSRFQTDMLPATETHISVWQSHKRGMTLQQTPAVPRTLILAEVVGTQIPFTRDETRRPPNDDARGTFAPHSHLFTTQSANDEESLPRV